MSKGCYVPITPAGTPLIHGVVVKLLAAHSEEAAWANLLKEASHMPYKDKAAFVKRGYTVEFWKGWKL